MRIISGKYKGRKLVFPRSKNIRPTEDRIKEAIFSVIDDKIEGAVCLDLFAGTGQIGAELFSRGASFVYLNDLDQDHLNVVYENVRMLGEEEDSKITRKDYPKAIRSFEEESLDLIYLDPPFNFGYEIKALKLIEDCKILKKSGIIVMETKLQELPDFDGIKNTIHKRYSDINVFVFERVD